MYIQDQTKQEEVGIFPQRVAFLNIHDFSFRLFQFEFFLIASFVSVTWSQHEHVVQQEARHITKDKDIGLA